MAYATLTTDFGSQDYYAGALKGALLRHCPDLHLVDITHAISPYNIAQAAYVLGNAYTEFPEDTMHIIGVNCAYQEGFRFVAARRNGHYFIAPDNGVLTLMFDGPWDQADVRNLGGSAGEHFAIKNVLPPAVGHLAAGLPWEALGTPTPLLLERIGLRPIVTPSGIRGTVMHVDHFDNAVLNIRRDAFERVVGARPFALYFKRHDPITRLSANYCDAPVGDPLCLFNSAGYLEIAVNMGKAATLLGLAVEEVVEVVVT
ncbi:MAG: SAM-dependent chlorinase/fluorinase [Saprospiraceae bacterium]|nr:SAM-dependent chlorinase/fluorinase [Saprospiraceae bacterium]